MRETGDQPGLFFVHPRLCFSKLRDSELCVARPNLNVGVVKLDRFNRSALASSLITPGLRVVGFAVVKPLKQIFVCLFAWAIPELLSNPPASPHVFGSQRLRVHLYIAQKIGRFWHTNGVRPFRFYSPDGVQASETSTIDKAQRIRPATKNISRFLSGGRVSKHAGPAGWIVS